MDRKLHQIQLPRKTIPFSVCHVLFSEELLTGGLVLKTKLSSILKSEGDCN